MKPIARLTIYAAVGLLVLCTSSCTTYQYSFIKTTNPEIIQNADKDFVKEDPRVRVSYCFFGEELPIQITVENKSDQPVFINWDESALIVEDAARSYVNTNIPISGRILTTTYNYRDYYDSRDIFAETQGEFYGEVHMPEKTTFIPPHSKITHTPLELNHMDMDKIPKRMFTEKQYGSSDLGNRTFKVAEFSERTSPLRFKSYLTFNTNNARGRRQDTWSMEHSFYISELIRGGNLKPNNLDAFIRQRGDFFYTADRKNNTLLIVGIGVAVTVASYIAVMSSKPEMDMSIPSW